MSEELLKITVGWSRIFQRNTNSFPSTLSCLSLQTVFIVDVKDKIQLIYRHSNSFSLSSSLLSQYSPIALPCYVLDGSCVLVPHYQLQTILYLVVCHSLVLEFLVSSSETRICLSCITCITQTVILDIHDFCGRKARPNLLVELGLQYTVDNQI